MTESLTLTLKRPGEDDVVTVTWNGHIETVEERGVPMPPRMYLWEMTPAQRERRLRAYAGRETTPQQP